MSEKTITPGRVKEHVLRLQEKYPPVPPASVDRSVNNPFLVRERFAEVIDYMARVELEVERNVLELVVLLPGVDETNRLFYEDVWGPQELHHGLILDQLQQDLGMPPAAPNTTRVSPQVKVLGVLSHIPAAQEIVKLMYYLTGAATEKSAMLAYQKMSDELDTMGEKAIAQTIINPIKVQEPGHFAFYKLSAAQQIQSGVLKPWQLHLTRFLRSKSFGLVGAKTPQQKGDYGAVAVNLGLDADIASYARDIARVEHQMLWAHKEGMEVPGYVLAALQDAVKLYKER